MVSTIPQVKVAMAANSETEAQSWMMILRAIFWPPPKPMPVIRAPDKSKWGADQNKALQYTVAVIKLSREGCGEY